MPIISLNRRPLLIGLVIVIAAILIGSSAILFRPYVPEATDQASLDDAEDDVEFVGEEYPGIIDLTSVNLEIDVGILNVTITLRDSVPEHLNRGEYARWLATIILQDGLIKAYEVYLEMNLTINQGELVGYFREVGEEAVPCTVERNGNLLTIYAPLEGLQSAKEILWSVQTSFEKWSEYELIADGFDYAPDEGLQSTIVKL